MVKDRIKRIVELGYGINQARSEWFVDVEIKNYAIPSSIHIFNVMSKESETYEGEIYNKDELDQRLIYAEQRLEEIWKRVQDDPLPKITRAAHRPLKELDHEKIIEMYGSGMTLEGIAKEMDCSIHPIRRILIPVYGDENDKLPTHRSSRKVGGRPSLDRGKITALHNAGWSNEKIADEMGCKPATVRDILREIRNGQAKAAISPAQ